MDTNSGQQPVAYECADNTEYQIADELESGSSYDLSGQPAGNKSDHYYDYSRPSFDICMEEPPGSAQPQFLQDIPDR